MIGKIARSVHYSILNAMPGPKKRVVKKKKKANLKYDHRDYRGPNGVLEDAQK
jgi:hypothetical protein